MHELVYSHAVNKGRTVLRLPVGTIPLSAGLRITGDYPGTGRAFAFALVDPREEEMREYVVWIVESGALTGVELGGMVYLGPIHYVGDIRPCHAFWGGYAP